MRAGAKGQGGTQEGRYGFGGLQWGALAPSKHKTTQAEAQMDRRS